MRAQAAGGWRAKLGPGCVCVCACVLSGGGRWKAGREVGSVGRGRGSCVLMAEHGFGEREHSWGFSLGMLDSQGPSPWQEPETPVQVI